MCTVHLQFIYPHDIAIGPLNDIIICFAHSECKLTSYFAVVVVVNDRIVENAQNAEKCPFLC